MDLRQRQLSHYVDTEQLTREEEKCFLAVLKYLMEFNEPRSTKLPYTKSISKFLKLIRRTQGNALIPLDGQNPM
jgi:hypothetical protein